MSSETVKLVLRAVKLFLFLCLLPESLRSFLSLFMRAPENTHHFIEYILFCLWKVPKAVFERCGMLRISLQLLIEIVFRCVAHLVISESLLRDFSR